MRYHSRMTAVSRRQAGSLGLILVVAVIAAAAMAGIAFARSTGGPIGDGVVVIETDVGYAGGQAAGTGMVLTSTGEVLTNNHVINGATTIRVIVPGTRHSYAATVLGYSIVHDVAVLQLRGASHLRKVRIGNSSKLATGQSVRALGNAGGTGVLTAVHGTITGLHKTITAGDGQGQDETLHGLIETDAAVQPGDSGGPLLDSSGHVIGMDTAASASGFRFVETATDAYAIPIKRAVRIAREVDEGHASTTLHIGPTAFLGVEVEPAAAAYGYGSSGALITGVVPGGPADAAGLAGGDLITAVNGHAVASPDGLTNLLQAKRPGTRIHVAITDQSGNQQTVTVTLGSGPPR
jgi:S1-C subfamily serine protease